MQWPTGFADVADTFKWTKFYNEGYNGSLRQLSYTWVFHSVGHFALSGTLGQLSLGWTARLFFLDGVEGGVSWTGLSYFFIKNFPRAISTDSCI